MNTGRSKLMISMALSLLMVIQVVLFLIFKSDAGLVLWSMMSVIVLMAILAVLINYQKVKSIEGKVDKLPEAYKRVYLDAREMVALSVLSKSMKEDINKAVLEIFEHAAIDKRDVNQLIGSDLKQFMKGFLEGSHYSFLYLFSTSSMLFFGYISLMKVYKLVRVDFNIANIASETLDFGIVFSYAVVAFVFFPWLMVVQRKSAMERWQMPKKLWSLLPLLIPFALLTVLVGFGNGPLRVLLDMPLPLMTSPFRIFIVVLGLSLSIVGISVSKKLIIKKY